MAISSWGSMPAGPAYRRTGSAKRAGAYGSARSPSAGDPAGEPAGDAVGAASLAAAAIAVTVPQTAQAHGAMQVLGSRTWLCYKEALTSTGQLIPNNPACSAAIAQSGSTSLYNWFAVARRDGATSGLTQ